VDTPKAKNDALPWEKAPGHSRSTPTAVSPRAGEITDSRPAELASDPADVDPPGCIDASRRPPTAQDPRAILHNR